VSAASPDDVPVSSTLASSELILIMSSFRFASWFVDDLPKNHLPENWWQPMTTFLNWIEVGGDSSEWLASG
jgi:hypothetical protein